MKRKVVVLRPEFVAVLIKRGQEWDELKNSLRRLNLSTDKLMMPDMEYVHDLFVHLDNDGSIREHQVIRSTSYVIKELVVALDNAAHYLECDRDCWSHIYEEDF